MEKSLKIYNTIVYFIYESQIFWRYNRKVMVKYIFPYNI